VDDGDADARLPFLRCAAGVASIGDVHVGRFLYGNGIA
jgi:hypothetical protein